MRFGIENLSGGLARTSAPHVEKALNRASWILPRIVAAVYPYSAFPMTRGWAERQPFGDLQQYAKNQGSDVAIFANFEEETSSILGEVQTAKVLPSQTARWLSACSDQVIFELPYLASDKPNPETLSTTADLLCLSASRSFMLPVTRAALAWCLYERTQDRAALARRGSPGTYSKSAVGTTSVASRANTTKLDVRQSQSGSLPETGRMIFQGSTSRSLTSKSN